MVVFAELLSIYEGIECFREMESVRIMKGGRTLLLEHLGFGPTTKDAARVASCNRFGKVEAEIHLELRGGAWLPYYFRNQAAGTEIFLYRFVGARKPLRLDFGAGLLLIQATAILDFSLLADGFVQAAEDALYHPLFSVTGGAA
ncbi:MAG: hypothetical protein HUU41_19860 [Bryobacteraceae bacterium]|nr:hypothetical protein [Bryobacteraceae bacterium]